MLKPADLSLRDTALLDDLLNPDARSRYPQGTRPQVRVDMSIRIYWHALFDICPSLMALHDVDGADFFESFMAWSAQQGLSMDWHWYLWVWRFLAESSWQDQVQAGMKEELMAAAVARWALIDRSGAYGVVLGCDDTDDWLVAWKPQSLEHGRVVERITLEGAAPRPPQDLGWFTCDAPELSHFPGWQALPR